MSISSNYLVAKSPSLFFFQRACLSFRLTLVHLPRSSAPFLLFPLSFFFFLYFILFIFCFSICKLGSQIYGVPLLSTAHATPRQIHRPPLILETFPATARAHHAPPPPQPCFCSCGGSLGSPPLLHILFFAYGVSDPDEVSTKSISSGTSLTGSHCGAFLRRLWFTQHQCFSSCCGSQGCLLLQ
jgi:hypothetical protein